MKDATVLVARILLAFMFIIAGWGKLGAGYAGTQQYMASMGVSGALLPLVIFAELGGGLGVLFGALTRIAAAGLAAFCILSALFFHTDFANQMQSIMFMKNFAIAGGMLMLAVHGAGTWSLDAWWQTRRK
ncbi:MAG: putative oxidoreductase [Azoarcus sp.]|nr:putative oxidoreductase [Azoarcus sp.]